MWELISKAFGKIVDLFFEGKKEDKKLQNAIKLEREKKELSKTSKDFIDDYIIILSKLDVLKEVSNNAKAGTGITVQKAGGATKSINKLSAGKIKRYTEIVTTFRLEHVSWKNNHHETFLKLSKETANAMYSIDNFFSHQHKTYTEQDFIKIFGRKNQLMLCMKEEFQNFSLI